METQISHSRLNEGYLFLALVMATGVHASAQALRHANQGPTSTLQITQWKDDLAGAVHFLHEFFPDINPMSKSIILNNLNWKSSPAGTGAFTIYICEPDSASQNAELRGNLLTRYDIQCAALVMRATFFMSGSPLGPLPSEVLIGRPDLDRRWGELSTLLLAHPEWSEQEIEATMKADGVKYGADSHDAISTLFRRDLPKLESFLGKLTIDSIDYSQPILTDKSQPGPPAWVVKAHPAGQDKSKPWIRYVLALNAYDGELDGETTFNELGRARESHRR